jgi:hypothetical protein
LVGYLGYIRPLGRSKSKWEEKIVIYLSHVWIGLTWLRICAEGSLLRKEQ